MRLRFFLLGVVSEILSPSPSPKRRFLLRVGVLIPCSRKSIRASAKHLLAVARKSIYLPVTTGVQFTALQCCSKWCFWLLGISSEQCLQKLLGLTYLRFLLSTFCFIRPVIFSVLIFSALPLTRGFAKCRIVSGGIAYCTELQQNC